MLSLTHLIQTIVHLIEFAIAYFLMLSIMTYNYWILVATLAGITIGYFLFGVNDSFANKYAYSTNSNRK